MSTTFNIIPTKTDCTLTFGNVMTLAEKTVNDYLHKLSIALTVKLFADIHDNEGAYIKEPSFDSLFEWKDNEYVWFTTDNIKGGTDAHYSLIEKQLSYWDTYFEDTLSTIGVTDNLKQQIINCKYEWYFRRSAGQLPVTNIIYGHLAAAVAQLTDGFIYSDDGAWHDNIFPIKADEFLGIYFYPDKAKNKEDYSWTVQNLQSLQEAFASR